MSLKNRLTVAVFEHLKSSTVIDYSYDNLFNVMWKNTSLTGGFALTEVGLDHLINVLKLKNWSVEVDTRQITSADILLLERYMTSPFYLNRYDGRKKSRTLTVFDEQVVTQIILYGGNLRYFLQAQDDASNRPITKN